jgi:3-deoxy-manno-octulosonate cytidylyltransferase (CMP-KDO synthetase)
MAEEQKDKPRIVAVIPARYASQRLPGKPLAKLLGRLMVEWVYMAASAPAEIDEVLVATDDERIADAVHAFGGEAVMTPPECPSGTDRIAAALKGRKADIVVNVQGDEPGMHPESIRIAVQALIDNDRADVSTVCIPIHDRYLFDQPHIVKVVRGAGDVALYFSRSPVPSPARRDMPEVFPPDFVFGYKHLGLYVYRREALEAFVRLEPGYLEQIEKLEQLRFLEVGATILCPETSHDSVGVDLQDDVSKAEELLRSIHGDRI